ncbi:MAG TPA: DUF2155 domain-containing protein [Brevundimonas sp.]|jgi:hypothetical protein|uniref:DUF2155 domain-containing protein n=1 Tax=Brevundimonas sp. TaxID=1871086 RepID=UPI002B741278|nr:DUF2155 domain-containing protein [Brevundimonas sp.]HRH21408.1 DUF2155 domain-containing protein [Brevundimonas sp.]
MTRSQWFAATVLVVLATAGLATATPAPVPAADPIVIPQPSQPATTPLTADTVTPPDDGDPTEGLPEEEVEAAAVPNVQLAGGIPVGRPFPEMADPLPRPRQGVAIIQALDKVTAVSIRFAVPVGQQRRWRGLVFRVRACETTATDEPMRDSVAYLEIFSQPRARDGAVDPRRVFQGWVFASSPALSGLEHPLYDAWVISCQAEAPSEA